MPDRVFHYRNPWVRLFMDSIVVALLIVAIVQQAQNRDLAHQLRSQQAGLAKQQTAFIKEQRRVNDRFGVVLAAGCRQSNGARLALKNLLIAVTAAERSMPSPNQTPAERRRSIQFFDAQIKTIHLTDCSRYTRATS